jgi:hypothetical protein
VTNRNQAIIPVALWAALLCGSATGAPADKYTATATIHIGASTPTILERNRQEYSEKEYQLFKKTQRAKLTSRRVLTAALRDKPELMKLASAELRMRSGDPVRWLQKIVKVELPDDTELMSVSITLGDPKAATALVNAVVDSYKTEVVDAEAEQKRARFAELDRAVVELEQDLRNKKQELRSLAAPPGRSSVDSELLELEIACIQQEYHDLHRELSRARIELHAVPRIQLFERAPLPAEPDEEEAVPKTAG